LGIGFGLTLLVLALTALLLPSARSGVGRVIALSGLAVLFYGYASGAYIAFTEDDLFGWLYLLLPPFAAYYFVSRWDEMRSRLVLVFIGLALLSGGGRLLEAEPKQPEPAAAFDEPSGPASLLAQTESN
jgi:hypothetical protein